MSTPHAGEIPNLNLLLGGFASWGMAKWATVQDIVVRSHIALDITEAEILAQHLLHDKYIEVAYKNGQEYEYVEPGMSGTQIGYEQLPGYALTRSGRQFHLDGGYRRERVEQAEIPKTKPDNHINPLTTISLRIWGWIRGLPLWSKIWAVFLVFLGAWLKINWDGQLTVESMRSLFGIVP
jgi:hypothetical protein